MATNSNNIASYTWAADYKMSFGTLNRKGAVTSGVTGVTMTPHAGTVSSAAVQGTNSENVEGATFYSVANNLSPVVEFSPLSEKSLSFEGGMETYPNRTSMEWAEGDLTLTSTYNNGETITDGSWSAISGPWGNGPLQNGDYSSNHLRNNRGGSYANHGVGFTFDLNPTFSTGRTDLRFHPDGGTPGTLGCIGLTGNATQLGDFRTRMTNYLSNHNSIDVNVNINDNPNNDGL